METKRALDAHEDCVTALAACHTHNFLVSASRDHTAVIWHLSRLVFIRQLRPHPGTVSAVAVNDANGAVATASGPHLYVWTLNGELMAQVNTAESGSLFANPLSLVLCLAFSTANEWDANNVVMCGTSDGLVKIYSIEMGGRRREGTTTAAGRQGAAEGGGGISPQGRETTPQRSVREHLLRRQQRIQHHHHHRQLLMRQGMSASSGSSTVTGEWWLRVGVWVCKFPPCSN